MGQLVLNNAKIFLGGCDVSADLNQVSVAMNAAMLNDNAFGDTAESNRAGLLKTTIDLEGFYNTAAGNPDGFDNTAFTALGQDNQLLTVFADGLTEGTSTDKGYAWPVTLSKYNPFANVKVGDLLAVSLSAQSQSATNRAIPLKNGTSSMVTASASGTKYQVGAVSGSQYLYAGLHVLEYQGTSPTLAVIVESDADGSAGGETTRITFNTVSGSTGAQYATRVAGAITDTYWRASWTIGGSSTPGFKFLIWMAIGT